ncbi:hypothetical protein diail_817, partial [Diaporthe ilicicola]
MKYIIVLLSALMGIMLSHAALSSDTVADPMDNYTIEDIKWTVQISPDRNDTVTGTIQDVADHLAFFDPKAFDILNKSIADSVEARPFGAPGVAFDVVNGTGYLCNIYPSTANGTRVEDGIEYLRKVKGSPTNGPGPGACGRVSCSYNAAIWWCNDNDYALTLDNYGKIADGAQDLVDDCSFYLDDGTRGAFDGIRFFDPKWS